MRLLGEILLLLSPSLKWKILIINEAPLRKIKWEYEIWIANDNI